MGYLTLIPDNVYLLLGEFVGTQTTLYYRKIMVMSWSEPEVISRANMEGSMVLDEEGNVYVVWGEMQSLYFAKRTVDGWTATQLVYTSATQSPGAHWLARGDNGTLHLVWFDSDFTSSAKVFYSQRPRQGNWESPTLIAPIVGTTGTDATIIVDQNDVPHLLWFDLIGLYYSSPSLAYQVGEATLEQVVSIPISQTVPTLSFFYWLDGTTGVGGSRFTVEATQGSNSTTLLSKQVDTSGWQHVSVDMTAYAGQTITLTFGLEQAANKPIVSVYLDEVTLGSTQADVWVEGDYQTALPGETVTYTITYGNRGAAAATGVTLNHTLAAGLTFVSATVAPTQINGSTLTWNLGGLSGSTGATTIFVTVQVNAAATPFTTLSSPLNISTTSNELENGNNQATTQIHLAQLNYLPIIIR